MASEIKVDTVSEKTANKGVKINKQKINARVYFAMGS
tara:strand:- start:731 stop:841 length:111 start_codon:yes stop_codon:yes gene_type:complete